VYERALVLSEERKLPLAEALKLAAEEDEHD
jgi:hypothetical protein